MVMTLLGTTTARRVSKNRGVMLSVVMAHTALLGLGFRV